MNFRKIVVEYYIGLLFFLLKRKRAEENVLRDCVWLVCTTLLLTKTSPFLNEWQNTLQPQKVFHNLLNVNPDYFKLFKVAVLFFVAFFASQTVWTAKRYCTFQFFVHLLEIQNLCGNFENVHVALKTCSSIVPLKLNWRCFQNCFIAAGFWLDPDPACSDWLSLQLLHRPRTGPHKTGVCPPSSQVTSHMCHQTAVWISNVQTKRPFHVQTPKSFKIIFHHLPSRKPPDMEAEQPAAAAPWLEQQHLDHPLPLPLLPLHLHWHPRRRHHCLSGL